MALTASKLGSGGSLNSAITKEFDDNALMLLKKKAVLRQLCDHRTIQKGHGTTANFFYWTRLDGGTGTTAEGTAPSSTAMTATSVEVSVNQYTGAALMTDVGLSQFRADLVRSGKELMAHKLADTLEQVVNAAMTATAITAYYANNGANLAATGADDTLDAEDLRILGANFWNDSVQPLRDNKFALVVSPYVMADLQSDTAPGGWLDVTRYTQGGTGAYTNETGSLWDFMLIRQHNTTSTTSGTDGGATVYTNIALGKEAVLDLELSANRPRMFFSPLGSSGAMTDPAHQNAAIAYRAWYGVKALTHDGPRIYRVFSAAGHNGI